VGDFVLFGVLLAGVGVGIELAMRRTGSKAYRAAVAVALVAAFFLVWLSLGVGIIGRDGDPVNGMYFGVLAVGVIGALIARFRPGGMTCALVATTIAQMLVAVIALLAGFGKETANYPLDILLLTTVFVVLWLVSARLFRRAVEKAS